MNNTLFSRRDALKFGALGVGAAFSPDLFAADAKSLPLITKAIPSSGEKIPVVGVGTNTFNESQLETLQAVLKRMSELGGTVIDTAASYGESEQTIGKMVAALGRSRFFISTKLTATGALGPPPGATGNRPPDAGPGSAGAGRPPGGMAMDAVGGEKSFERSLERLKTDHLDLLMVHSLNGVDELMPKLQEWKQAGKIRYLGMTTSNTAQQGRMVEYLRKYPVDFVQVNYSIESREAAQTVFPLAMERKVAVMVNVPFGGRGGRTLLSANNRELPKWAADIGVASWAQFLLKYVVSHPVVTVAIPGSTKLTHIEDNLTAAHGVLPDAAMRKRMEEFWDAKG